MVAAWHHLPVIAYCHDPERQGGQAALYELVRQNIANDPICILTDQLSVADVLSLLQLGSHIYFGVTPSVAESAILRPWETEGQVMRALPLERLLVQTAAPHLPSHPWMAAFVYEDIARFRGVELQVLEVLLAANFRRFFARPPVLQPGAL